VEGGRVRDGVGASTATRVPQASYRTAFGRPLPTRAEPCRPRHPDPTKWTAESLALAWRAWLGAALAAVDRCVTPWLVLAGHRPLYVPFPHKSNREVGAHLRSFLEPLLETHAVDVYLSGHVHAYARTCNVWRGGQCVPRPVGGTTHVMAVTGGRRLSDIAGDQSDWLDAAALVWGFVRLDAGAGTRCACSLWPPRAGGSWMR
jgi:hypothetical protein